MAGLRGSRREGGYILLDALIALFIVLAGLGVSLGGISLAGRMTVRLEERVLRLIEERNAQAMAPARFNGEE